MTEKTKTAALVTVANALNRAAQSLTLAEKRVVCCAIAQLDSRAPIPAGAVQVSRVTAADYARVADVADSNTAYRDLKAAVRSLYMRSISFTEPVEGAMRWVGQAHYLKSEGAVELYWWPPILPYLMGLKDHFTSYPLGQAKALRSIYTWRLLELLNQFKSTGVLVITVEDFAHAMDANEKLRADFGQLRRRTIEPAVRELTEKNGWDIAWAFTKAGRTVKTLRFDFDTHEPATPKRAQLPAPAAKPASTYVDPASQSTAHVPSEKPAKRTPESRAKAREALAAAKKAAKGKAA